MEKKVMQFRIF